MLAIIVACLWPIESVYIAVVNVTVFGIIASDPVEKIVLVLLLLLTHCIYVVWLLFCSEILQAFLDIAKNTEDTAEAVGQLLGTSIKMQEGVAGAESSKPQ
jgi:hypothetical protein